MWDRRCAGGGGRKFRRRSEVAGKGGDSYPDSNLEDESGESDGETLSSSVSSSGSGEHERLAKKEMTNAGSEKVSRVVPKQKATTMTTKI